MVILPSTAMLKQLSTLIRNKRLAANLSQSALAADLCTQATISELENCGNFNKWTIIPALLARLNISDMELENIGNYVYGIKQLERAEKLILIKRFDKAYQQLKLLKVTNFDYQTSKARYYCDAGFVDVLMGHSLDDAIMNFNAALDRLAEKDKITEGFVNLGLAIAYHRMKLSRISRQYLKQAITIFKRLSRNFNCNCSKLLWILAILGICIASFSYITQQFETAHSVCMEGIKFLTRNHSHFCLQDFYYLDALVLTDLGRAEAAKVMNDNFAMLQGLKEKLHIKPILKIVAK